MAYSASDFLADMTGIAARVGVTAEDYEDPQKLACVLAYRLGLAEGRKSLHWTTLENAVRTTHYLWGVLREKGVFAYATRHGVDEIDLNHAWLNLEAAYRIVEGDSP